MIVKIGFVFGVSIVCAKTVSSLFVLALSDSVHHSPLFRRSLFVFSLCYFSSSLLCGCPRKAWIRSCSCNIDWKTRDPSLILMILLSLLKVLPIYIWYILTLPLLLICVQVRRSSYHDVVKMADISRLADISGIQAYVINGSKVVFLRRRPQPRPPKGAVGASQCVICSRHLQDVSSFCSLQCKIDSDAGITHVSLRSDSGNDSKSVTGPDTPSHLSGLKPLGVQDAGSDSDSGWGSYYRYCSCFLRKTGCLCFIRSTNLINVSTHS